MKPTLNAMLIALCIPTLAAAWAPPTHDDALLCYSLVYNPRLKEISAQARTVMEVRRAAKMLYFFEVPEPLERSFASTAEGGILRVRGRILSSFGFSRVFMHEDGTATYLYDAVDADKGRAGRAEKALDDSERVRLEDAARRWRALLPVIRQPEAGGKRAPTPFDFLGAELYLTAGPAVSFGALKGLGKVRTAYESNPSDLAALVYLELALVERNLGQVGRSQKTLNEALQELDLLKVDFREDAQFRQHLHESFNFARPECVILFLAGDAAAKRGEPELAEKYYSILIERAPASPFAWECFGKLARLPGVDQDRVARLEQLLVKTYPLVWGCRRNALKVEPSQVASTVSTLLRAFGP
jgi:hypothetical protein